MKKVIIFVCLFCVAYICDAQVGYNKVKPVSLDTNNVKLGNLPKKKIKKLHDISAKKVNGIKFDELEIEIKEKLREDSTFSPIGKGVPANIDVIREGEWEKITDSVRICRKKVYIENSLSLILVFEKFYLPEGSSLLIYDPDGIIVLGPLTSKMNKPYKKLMTNALKGPEVILEYCEKINTAEKPELFIKDIGICFKYDSEVFKEKKEKKKTNKTLEYMPYADLFCTSDYSDFGLEGCPAICKIDDSNPNDPVRRMVSSSCMLLLYGGGFFTNKPASLVRGADDCKPIIITAGHVIFDNDNYFGAYSVVRFNWLRKLPTNASNIPVANRSATNCFWANDIPNCDCRWLERTSVENVIDYFGTKVEKYFPNGKDIGILSLNTNLVHIVWKSGWDARPDMGLGTSFELGESTGNNAVILSTYAYIPTLYTQGNLRRDVGDIEFSYKPMLEFPLYPRSGYSGSPGYFKQTINNIEEFLFVGPLTKGDGLVIVLNKLASCYENDVVKTLLGNIQEKYLKGIWFEPQNSNCVLPECCNFFYSGTKTEDIPNNGTECCNIFKLHERMLDSYECGIYKLKMFKVSSDGSETQVQFVALDRDPNLLVNEDEINFSTFQKDSNLYKVCELIETGQTSSIRKYFIRLYRNESGVDVKKCEREIFLSCKRECNCDDNRYNIDIEEVEGSETCCYKATICMKGQGDPPTCKAKFIQVFADKGDGNDMDWNDRLLSSFWYSPDELSINTLESGDCDLGQSHAVIDNICVFPDEKYFKFRIWNEQVFDENYPIIPFNFFCDKKKIPIKPCKCCDVINIKPVEKSSTYILYNIESMNPFGCEDLAHVTIKSYFEDNNGNLTELNDLDYSAIISQNRITINNPFLFSKYMTKELSTDEVLVDIEKTTHSRIKLIAEFRPTANGNVICTKEFYLDDVYNNNQNFKDIRFKFSQNNICNTLFSIDKNTSTYNSFKLEKKETTWTIKCSSFVCDDIVLTPGLYRATFDNIDKFYFYIDKWNCRPDIRSFEVEKVENTTTGCRYRIKSNLGAGFILKKGMEVCTLSTQTGSEPFYFEDAGCSLLKNDTDKDIEIELSYSSGCTEDCIRNITIPACEALPACCKPSTSIEVIENPLNETGPADGCCYKFRVRDFDCPVDYVEIMDDDNTIIATVHGGLSALYETPDWFCFPASTQSHEPKLILHKGTMQACTLNLPKLVCEYCDKIKDNTKIELIDNCCLKFTLPSASNNVLPQQYQLQESINGNWVPLDDPKQFVSGGSVVICNLVDGRTYRILYSGPGFENCSKEYQIDCNCCSRYNFELIRKWDTDQYPNCCWKWRVVDLRPDLPPCKIDKMDVFRGHNISWGSRGYDYLSSNNENIDIMFLNEISEFHCETCSEYSNEHQENPSLKLEFFKDNEKFCETESVFTCMCWEFEEIPRISLNNINSSQLDVEKFNTILNLYSVPNPTSSMTNVYYELSDVCDVVIEVYDILGNKLDVLKNGSACKGLNKLVFQTDKYSEGMYNIIIKACNSVENLPITIIK